MGLLNNAASSGIGKTAVDVYTTPSGKNGILIGGNIANVSPSFVNADIKIKRGNTFFFIIKGLQLPPNVSFSFSGQEQKVVLSPGDAITVVSDVDTSVDVWLSLSEMAV